MTRVSIRSPPTGRPTSRCRVSESSLHARFQSAPRRRGDPPCRVPPQPTSPACFNPLPADGETHLPGRRPLLEEPLPPVSIRSPPTGRPTDGNAYFATANVMFQSAPRRRGDPPTRIGDVPAGRFVGFQSAPRRRGDPPCDHYGRRAVLRTVSIRSPPTGRPTWSGRRRALATRSRFNPLPADGETHRRHRPAAGHHTQRFNPLPRRRGDPPRDGRFDTGSDPLFQSAPRRRGDPPRPPEPRELARPPGFNPLPADGETHLAMPVVSAMMLYRFNPLPADGETHPALRNLLLRRHLLAYLRALLFAEIQM